MPARNKLSLTEHLQEINVLCVIYEKYGNCAMFQDKLRRIGRQNILIQKHLGHKVASENQGANLPNWQKARSNNEFK